MAQLKTPVLCHWTLGLGAPYGDAGILTMWGAYRTLVGATPTILSESRIHGEPIMESQIVVDYSEIDGKDFLVSTVGHDSYAVNELSAQIKSIELRAASRDTEIRQSQGVAETQESYMLNLESRELRKQARGLKSQRSRLMAAEADSWSDRPDAEVAGGIPAIG